MRDGSVITMKGGGGGLQNFQLNGRQINPFPKLNGRLVRSPAQSHPIPSVPFDGSLYVRERKRETERGDNNDDAGDDDRDAAAAAGKRMEERSDADVSVQGRTRVGRARMVADGEHVGDGKVPWETCLPPLHCEGKTDCLEEARSVLQRGRKQSRLMTQTVSRHCLVFLFHWQ